MKTRLQVLFIGCLFLFTFIGCKKENTNASKLSIVTSKSWRNTVFTASVGSVVVQDLLQGIPACELDNVIKFSTNGTYTIEEGATRCSSTDPTIVDNGTWKLESNDTKFNFDGEVFDVVEISNNIIKLKATETLNNILVTVDVTFQP